jgi:hypothetical protein
VPASGASPALADQARPASATTATVTATASRRPGRWPSTGQASSTVTTSEAASTDWTANSGSTRIASTEASQASESAARPATYHGRATTPSPVPPRAARACTTEAAPYPTAPADASASAKATAALTGASSAAHPDAVHEPAQQRHLADALDVGDHQ